MKALYLADERAFIRYVDIPGDEPPSNRCPGRPTPSHEACQLLIWGSAAGT